MVMFGHVYVCKQQTQFYFARNKFINISPRTWSADPDNTQRYTYEYHIFKTLSWHNAKKSQKFQGEGFLLPVYAMVPKSEVSNFVDAKN